MFYEKRRFLFNNYNRARDYFITYPEQLMELEKYCTELVNNIIINNYDEIGLPSGADNRFVLYSDDIANITHGFTNCAFFFLDIKSVGPRDNFNHTVISPYQVSGDSIWKDPNDDMENSTMVAEGKKAIHLFYPAISPIYPLTNGDIAPTIHPPHPKKAL